MWVVPSPLAPEGSPDCRGGRKAMLLPGRPGVLRLHASLPAPVLREILQDKGTKHGFPGIQRGELAGTPFSL